VLTLDETQLDALWKALGSDDASAAYAARWKLIATQGQAVAYLRRHLRPAPALDADQKNWIARLDSAAYKERQQAMSEVVKMGEAVEPALRAILQQNPTLELRQRAESLLIKVSTPPTGPTLRTLRAIGALHAIDTDESREVLRELADGAAGARVTQAARAALDR
jgi:hypothetical protein